MIPEKQNMVHPHLCLLGGLPSPLSIYHLPHENEHYEIFKSLLVNQMLLALCKGVEKLSYPGKLIRHFKRNNLVEKIFYYTLSFILPSFYNALNRQRGLSSHKRSPVECLENKSLISIIFIV